jgi:hypothetical protein
MVEIILRGKAENGEWFDIGTKSIVSGMQHAFEVKDEISGVWNLNVRIQHNLKKADSKAIASSNVGYKYDQIKRKTITFNETSDMQRFYNVIGIAYIDENGRLHSKRIIDINDVPEEIKSNFEIKKYQEVSPYQNITFKDKLVILIDKNKVEDMALLFFLQKIKPVLSES